MMFVITLLGLLSMYLTGRKNPDGWFVGILSQFMWAVYAWDTGDLGLLIPAAAYTLVFGYNYYLWVFNDENKPEKIHPPGKEV